MEAPQGGSERDKSNSSYSPTPLSPLFGKVSQNLNSSSLLMADGMGV
jgi:hypothetical protein